MIDPLVVAELHEVLDSWIEQQNSGPAEETPDIRMDDLARRMADVERRLLGLEASTANLHGRLDNAQLLGPLGTHQNPVKRGPGWW